MVWNTTQSSLYRAVSDYNNEIDRREHRPRAEKASDRSESRRSDVHPSRDCSDDRRGAPKPHDRAPNRGKRRAGCPNCPNCPNSHDPQNSQNGNSQNFGGLNIDRDFLLLAGLIFILSENGADNKLIAALAIALLG